VGGGPLYPTHPENEYHNKVKRSKTLASKDEGIKKALNGQNTVKGRGK